MKTRRNVDDDDNNCIKNAKIDRDDDSINDLTKLIVAIFFVTKNFIDKFHLMNY